jgi:DNA-directed RNA polymerase specialized sigma24 family protein
MDLATPLDMICRIIIRARELEAPKPTIAPDDVDDLDVSEEDEFDALESETDETVEDELRTAIEDLADDQQIELLALAMVGRGTYDASEWEDALDAANDPNGESPADQLLDMPTLAEYLDAGLAAFDLSCDGIGQID